MKWRETGKRIRRLARSTVVILGAACAQEQDWCDCADDSQTALESWFFCNDCVAGERDAVRALANTGVQPIDRVLTRIPEDWDHNVQLRYSEAAKRARLSGSDSVAYVSHYVVNFRSTVWSRSAISLADINTPDARAVLQEALDSSAARGYRSDVVREIRQALVAVTTAPLDGNFQPSSAGFLDTVVVTRPGIAPWDGDESVTLHGAPFPDDASVGFRAGNTQLRFVAAARPGDYSFTVRNVGPAQDSQFARIRITSFPAAATTEVRDLTAGPFPVTILQSFSRATTPPDYVHYFRFQPPAATALTVTATAEWAGPSQIALVWEDCSNRQGVATNRGRITAVTLDAAGNSGLGATVTLTPLSGGSGTMFALPGGGVLDIPVPLGWIGRMRVEAAGLTPRELVAWEGAATLRFVLPFGPAGPVVSDVTTQPSPNSASQTIPGGGCRLLAVLQSDTTRAPPIVKLRVTRQ